MRVLVGTEVPEPLLPHLLLAISFLEVTSISTVLFRELTGCAMSSLHLVKPSCHCTLSIPLLVSFFAGNGPQLVGSCREQPKKLHRLGLADATLPPRGVRCALLCKFCTIQADRKAHITFISVVMIYDQEALVGLVPCVPEG